MANRDIEQARDFIYRDIEREIALAKATETAEGKSFLEKAGVPSGGGNFMAALALLSYTEYAGRLKNNDFSDRLIQQYAVKAGSSYPTGGE